MAEITVMGAGILGLSLAWALRQRGAQVRVLEKRHPGAGSSGGTVGALAPHVPEQWNAKKQFQFESLRMAPEFWATIAEVSGRDPGYVRLGRVQPLLDDAAIELAQTRAENAQTLWQGFAEWRVCETRDLPVCRLHSPTGLVVFDTLSARLSPRRACDALTAALARSGVPVEQGDTATGTVIWATGADGLADLSQALGQSVGAPVKGQSALLQADWRHEPQLFIDGLHIVPHGDGTVGIGSTTERDWTDTGPDAQLDTLIDTARRACPDLTDAPVIDRWAGLRPRARSRAPMLGPWPGRPGHFVLNGGFKIGFGMAPRLAQVMADLVLDGVDNIPNGFRLADNLRK